MSEQLQPNSEIVFRGKLFEIVQNKQPNGQTFERAVRAPGVRLIIADKPNKKVLLTKEFRGELGAWDYRLPGGKVFDTLAEYDDFKAISGDIEQAAVRKAKGEGSEEAGVDIESLELIKKSTLGATVEWDLWVFDATSWQKSEAGQQLEAGEQIEADNWFTYAEARQMVLGGHMQEERVALILLQWLEVQNAEFA